MTAAESPRLRIVTEPQRVGLDQSVDRPLLDQVFAAQVFDITRSIEDNFPVGSLVLYSDLKRRQLDLNIGNRWRSAEAYLSRIPQAYAHEIPQRIAFIEDLKQQQQRLTELPQSPQSWKDLLRSIDAPHRRVLMQALTGKLREDHEFGGHYRWLHSKLSVGDLREIEVSDDFATDPYSPVTETFLARAF